MVSHNYMWVNEQNNLESLIDENKDKKINEWFKRAIYVLQRCWKEYYPTICTISYVTQKCLLNYFSWEAYEKIENSSTVIYNIISTTPIEALIVYGALWGSKNKKEFIDITQVYKKDKIQFKKIIENLFEQKKIIGALYAIYDLYSPLKSIVYLCGIYLHKYVLSSRINEISLTEKIQTLIENNLLGEYIVSNCTNVVGLYIIDMFACHLGLTFISNFVSKKYRDLFLHLIKLTKKDSKDRLEKIEYTKKMFSHIPFIEIIKSEELIREDKLDGALTEIKLYNEKKKYFGARLHMGMPYFLEHILERIGNIPLIIYKKRRMKKEQDEHKKMILTISLSYNYEILGKRREVIKTHENLIKENPDEIKYQILLTQRLEEYNKTQEALEQHKLIFIRLQKEGKYKFVPCGETTKKVWEIEKESSPFLHSCYVYKETTPEEAEQTKRLVEDNERVIKGKNKYLNMKYAGCIPVEIEGRNTNISILKRAEGELLYDRMEKKENRDEIKEEQVKRNIEDIIEYLVLLDVKMPHRNYRKRINAQEKIKTALSNPRLKLPENLFNLFDRSYIKNNAIENQTIYVFNKDSHPENFVVVTTLSHVFDYEQIAPIDWDEKGEVPQIYQLINLQEYNNYLGINEKIENCIKYRHMFNKMLKTELIKDEELFLIDYFNRTYERMIAFVSAWSNPERPIMQKKRSDCIDHALVNVDVIEQNHHAFYKRYEDKFKSRIDGLNQLKETLVFMEGNH